jgi:hypothetical protein
MPPGKKRTKAVFDFNTLSPSLKRLLPQVDAGVDLAFGHMRDHAESYARANAPWVDRTGNARNGLFAAHEKTPMVEHRLIVYHTMPYGLWLEVRWSGRYAIIGPTMLHVSPLLAITTAEAVKRAVDLLGD